MADLKNYGRTTVSESLGDRIVYRNLAPADTRLPPLTTFHREIGLLAGKLPRKNEPEYAQAIAYLLDNSRWLETPSTRIERLIFLGDTHVSGWDRIPKPVPNPELARLGFHRL